MGQRVFKKQERKARERKEQEQKERERAVKAGVEAFMERFKGKPRQALDFYKQYIAPLRLRYAFHLARRPRMYTLPDKPVVVFELNIPREKLNEKWDKKSIAFGAFAHTVEMEGIGLVTFLVFPRSMKEAGKRTIVHEMGHVDLFKSRGSFTEELRARRSSLRGLNRRESAKRIAHLAAERFLREELVAEYKARVLNPRMKAKPLRLRRLFFTEVESLALLERARKKLLGNEERGYPFLESGESALRHLLRRSGRVDKAEVAREVTKYIKRQKKAFRDILKAVHNALLSGVDKQRIYSILQRRHWKLLAADLNFRANTEGELGMPKHQASMLWRKELNRKRRREMRKQKKRIRTKRKQP